MCKNLLSLSVIVSFFIIGCSSHKSEINLALKQASNRPEITNQNQNQSLNNSTGTKLTGDEIAKEKLKENANFFREAEPGNFLFEQASTEKINLGQTISLVEERQQREKQSEEDEASEIPLFSEILKRDIKDLPKSLWEDTKKVYLDKTNIAVLLIAGGATLAVRNTVDDKWEDHFHRTRTLEPQWGDTAGVLGNPGLHLGLAAVGYYCSVKGGDTKMYKVSKTLFNALVINDLSTVLLKAAASTNSPNGEHHAWPSGHVSSTMCLAAVIDKYYGHKIGIPLYLLAGFVGLERMDDREHHFSDVLFGAALGYIIGKTVAENHSPEILGGKIVPYVNPYDASSGIAWVKDF